MFGLGKIQEAQKKMGEVKARLATITVKGESGQVSIEVSGAKRVKSVTINGEVQDKAALQNDIVNAFNKAIEEAESMSKSEMEKAAKDFLPPGMGGMLNGILDKLT